MLRRNLRGLRGGSLLLIAAAMAWAPARGSVAELRAGAEAFAGQPVRIDQRIAVPDCAGGYEFAADADNAARLRAHCAATGWQMWIPLAATPPIADFSLRRGQSLLVHIGGAGYQARAKATVQSFDRRTGLVLLRNTRSGQIFQGRVQPDGSIEVSGRESN